MTIPPTTRSALELSTGVRLPYVEQGERDGVPVLLLHGVTDSWRSFAPLLPHLPPALRVCAVTQRGHAGASRPRAGYRIADLTADAAAVLDALGLDDAVVVGHSMGSVVAQRLALDHPERVRGLVLLNSFSALARNAGVRELWDGAVAPLRDPIDARFVRAFQAGTVTRPIAADFLDLVVGESLAVPARIWRALFAGFLRTDFFDQLGAIAAPTLILAGGRDAICPVSDQQALAAAIPGARLTVVPEAGHSLHWEDPAYVAAALAAFLAAADGVSAPRTAPRSSR